MLSWLTRQNDCAAVADLDVPAMVLDDRSTVQAQSPHSSKFVQLLNYERAIFSDLVAKVLSTSTLTESVIRSERSGLSFSLFLFPARKKNQVVVIGHDLTLSDQVTTALAHSRSMFRDMVSSGSLFGFEVDAAGYLTYIGPGMIFGMNPDSLVGRKASDLFWPDRPPKENPFAATQPFKTAPLKTQTPEGEFYLSFTGTVARDKDGAITHVRGLVQDNSALMEEKRVAKHHSLRMTLQNNLIRLLQQSTNAADLLDQTAATLSAMLRADSCSIFMKTSRGFSLVADTVQTDADTPKDEIEILTIERLTEAVASQPTTDGAFDLVIPRYNGDAPVLAVRLKQDNDIQGLVLVKRNSHNFPWSVQEKALLSGVAEHMVLALKQAELIEKLTHLSSRDDLTGLMNRRAFMDTIRQRLKFARASGQQNLLLYIDLDHFKEINDTLGHAAGDLALKLIATMLEQEFRDQDCVARIGGDEFLIWMTGADEAAGAAKAQVMLDNMAAIRREISKEELGLSLSIGIILSDSSWAYKVEDMTDYGDRLMYQAKKAGKATYVTGKMADIKPQGDSNGL